MSDSRAHEMAVLDPSLHLTNTIEEEEEVATDFGSVRACYGSDLITYPWLGRL